MNRIGIIVRDCTQLGLLLLIGTQALAGGAANWSGNVSLDARIFQHEARLTDQDDNNGSIAFEPEFYTDWNDGDDRIVFHPFARLDSADEERTHADIRELYWRRTYDDIELKVGVAKIFWGVAESQHLVDIINQTDLVENIDTEDKLGQPMVHLSWVKDWGTLDLFVLPYFRERTFPGEEGRLRTNLVVDADNALYESSDEQEHVDVAVRWSHFIGDWDIGLAHFSGTSRDPLFIPTMAGSNLVLTPFYQQIEQTSLDLQATKGDWLWKLEAIANQNDIEDYIALVAGFEYTIVGALGASDLGVLIEYNYDDRDDSAITAFEDDLFVGARLALNDSQSSEILAGLIMDRESSAHFANIEASRRIGDSWNATLEIRLFSNFDSSEFLYDLRNDDYIELQVAKYF